MLYQNRLVWDIAFTTVCPEMIFTNVAGLRTGKEVMSDFRFAGTTPFFESVR